MGENSDVITLDLAQQESDKGWLSLYWRYYSVIAGVMADNQGANDYRVELLTNLTIATIPDPEVRKELKKQKAEALNNISSGNVDEKNRIVMEICMDILGNVTTEIDKSIGISQKIGVCIE